MIKVMLIEIAGSPGREARIRNFYVRPRTVVTKDGSVYLTEMPEDQRAGLEYVRVSSATAE